MRPSRTIGCVLLAAATMLAIPGRSGASGPFDVGSWCPQGGVRYHDPPVPFIVPPPPTGYVWSLLVLASKGPAAPYVVAYPSVGAAYVDPYDVPSDAILCQESTDPPTTTAAPTTVVETTTTTTAIETTTTAPTTTTLPPTTIDTSTTTIVGPTTTLAPPPVIGPPTTLAPPPPPIAPGTKPPPGSSPTPPTLGPGTTVASEAPVPAEPTTSTTNTLGTTTSAPATPTTSTTSTASRPTSTTPPDQSISSPADAASNLPTLRQIATDAVAHHRSTDGLVFFLLLAGIGVGVFFTGRHHR